MPEQSKSSTSQGAGDKAIGDAVVTSYFSIIGSISRVQWTEARAIVNAVCFAVSLVRHLGN